ncbi:unnamed protein product [Dovyalis caffra]|uniref:K-box domain-containing protein n=1 Tax=Dovyalis caffra TaxID=77055 RepID=A0AAV1QWQ3_9ROSI|nr:unnamed protein product [Dovyalis caffra]
MQFDCCNVVKQNKYQEYLKLKGRVDGLQRSQRNLLGEDLGNLDTKELDQLENQLDSSLKQIRCRKLPGRDVEPETSAFTHFMILHLAELAISHTHVVHAQTVAHMLDIQLEETTVAIRSPWKVGQQRVPYSCQPAQPDDFVDPLQYSSSLQIGYDPVETDQVTLTNTSQNVNGFIPGWMQ